MKISVIAASDLDLSLQATWRTLQSSNPVLQSPYFAPEFTLAVAGVRPDVRIAVLEDGARVVGFFAHQARWGMGWPVGGILSDHHGVVCASGTCWDWRTLLRAAGLASWRFDHLPHEQAPAGAILATARSPGLDLSQGFEAYQAARRARSRRLSDLDRKARKLARELGPLRFTAHTTDPRIFEAVIRLKSQQCQRTGATDFFARDWTRALTERICAIEQPDFGGRLSALYAGDALVGAHLGMRSRRVWHWWFPVYEHAAGAYSPGALLLLHVAQAAADQGHDLLDLGKGNDAYKKSFADDGLPLAEGWIHRHALSTAWLSTYAAARRWAKTARLTQPLRRGIKRARHLVASHPALRSGPGP